MRSMPAKREMEDAYRQRDESYDGIFFLGVRTTGVFCRPSCPAKKPLAKNVEYFATASEALFSGYRPCKRCRPMHTNGRPPDWVDQLLTRVEKGPGDRIRDADLRAMSIDPARARRYFKRHYGMTFQAYNRARRMGEALMKIRQGADLTNVAFGHGYDSNSGFRDAFERTFGRAPGRCRSTDCIVTQALESPIGPLIICATPSAVCFLEFTDRRALETQVETLRRRFDRAIVPGTNEHIEQLRDELGRYFAGELQRFRAAIEYPGTPFQRAVWERLLQIPYGETLSYSRLAQDVGREGAQRAVGHANGQNRLAIVIPCHRVVNKNGRLGGYGGGLWRKQFLLDLERGAVSSPACCD
ncbi:MAG: bifunctional transcriptional activator/DNA repair enzyme AdaA [Planctomycetota bacterium]|jgi:AraC family transcriptional regulator of adaptative response/methylated-DNA-[protein]-cysteine methyltransferase